VLGVVLALVAAYLVYHGAVWAFTQNIETYKTFTSGRVRCVSPETLQDILHRA
jgi:hypothetical protein